MKLYIWYADFANNGYYNGYSDCAFTIATTVVEARARFANKPCKILDFINTHEPLCLEITETGSMCVMIGHGDPADE